MNLSNNGPTKSGGGNLFVILVSTLHEMNDEYLTEAASDFDPVPSG